MSVAKCPNCNNNKIEWMPISKVDVDKLSHSPKGAIELHNSTAL
ncbi:MAG: hypothetical protein ACJ71J_13275 [Nitrososphaeraceae archaeon]